MLLTDTGPLVALVDRNDAHHAVCQSQIQLLAPPMVTPWPCFTEAMYLLHRAGGSMAQDELWGFVAAGALLLHASDASEQARMRQLMEKYRDRPMDLADAAVVAAAEVLKAIRVFSIDSDFYVYRLSDGRALEVVPGPLR